MSNNLRANEHADKIQALKDFLVNGNGLIRILEKETEYYKNMKMSQAEKLIEAKQSMVSKLEDYKRKLTSDISFLKRLPADVKTRIKETNIALGKAADANYREAVKAKEVNKIILESVSKAIEKSQGESLAYSSNDTPQNGSISNGSNNLGSKAAPVAIDQSV